MEQMSTPLQKLVLLQCNLRNATVLFSLIELSNILRKSSNIYLFSIKFRKCFRELYYGSYEQLGLYLEWGVRLKVGNRRSLIRRGFQKKSDSSALLVLNSSVLVFPAAFVSVKIGNA